MSRRVLVTYASAGGQTAKIARRITEALTLAGDRVVCAPIDELPSGTSPYEFDGVVLGAPLHGGKHPRIVRRFVQRHRDALTAVPSAFFSVSASAASRDAQGRADAWRCLGQFTAQTEWNPRLTATIAGAIAYTKYNPLLRWWMRRICEKAGGPTDTSRDHELTDWSQVERFARSFADEVNHTHGSALELLTTGH